MVGMDRAGGHRGGAARMAHRAGPARPPSGRRRHRAARHRGRAGGRRVARGSHHRGHARHGRGARRLRQGPRQAGAHRPARAAPQQVSRYGGADLEVVPMAEVVAGDRILVRPGEVVPVDGLVMGSPRSSMSPR